MTSMFSIGDGNAFAEYLQWQQRQCARYDAALVDEQKAITWGDHFILLLREGGWLGSGPVTVQFGVVLTLEELNETEDAATVSQLVATHSSYLYSRTYWQLEPEGEYGSKHRWYVWPITAEQFQQAAWTGWDPGDMTIQPWIIDAWTDLMQKRIWTEDEPLPSGVIHEGTL